MHTFLTHSEMLTCCVSVFVLYLASCLRSHIALITECVIYTPGWWLPVEMYVHTLWIVSEFQFQRSPSHIFKSETLCVASRCWGCGGETCRSQRGSGKTPPWPRRLAPRPRQPQWAPTFPGSLKPHDWAQSSLSSSWLLQHRLCLASSSGPRSSSPVTR